MLPQQRVTITMMMFQLSTKDQYMDVSASNGDLCCNGTLMAFFDLR